MLAQPASEAPRLAGRLRELREREFVRLTQSQLGSLVDVDGAIRSYNPTSRVVIMATENLRQRDVANHLVVIGGLAWKTVRPWFARIFPIPIKAEDPADRGAIAVDDPDCGQREFKYSLLDGVLVEDVGFSSRGENPTAPLRMLTVIGGITTRGPTYCIVIRMPVVNGDPLTPDLCVAENRLFEWSAEERIML